ncbi:MAG: GtrA family protein [Chthoniobacteraceae bacterium]
MQAQSTPVVAKRKQQLRSRFFWFVAGAAVNYTLISVPFKWLKQNTDLPIFAVSALSVGVGVTFFFLWNYFVNFRTDSRKRDALARYITAVAIMWALSATTLTILKHFNAQMAFSLLGRIPLDLDIVATQFFLAGIKFLLYHKWVFPLPKDDPAPPTQDSLSSIPSAAEARR